MTIDKEKTGIAKGMGLNLIKVAKMPLKKQLSDNKLQFIKLRLMDYISAHEVP